MILKPQKIARVALFEFRQTLKRRSALLMIFGLPFLVVLLLLGLNWLSRSQPGAAAAGPAGAPATVLGELVQGERDMSTPAGLVDQSGRIDTLSALARQLFRQEQDIASAAAAFERGEIRSYYVIPPDFVQQGEILYYAENIASVRRNVEERALFQSIAASLLDDPALQQRLLSPAEMAEVNLDPVQEGSAAGGSVVLTIAIAMLFYATSVGASGYLLQSLGQEKQNRVMEILLSSVRPSEMLVGKMVGLGAIGLLQMAIWSIIALLLFGGSNTLFDNISLPELSAATWLLVVAHFVVGYLLYASLFAGLGAIAPNPKESSQYTFLLMIPVLLPVWLNNIFWTAPNSSAALVMSIFPLTAPVAMPMRLTASAIPAWQWSLSLGLGLLTAVSATWLAARVFRGRALLSGQSLSLRFIADILRG